jgi:hypothetical protein
VIIVENCEIYEDCDELEKAIKFGETIGEYVIIDIGADFFAIMYIEDEGTYHAVSHVSSKEDAIEVVTELSNL